MTSLKLPKIIGHRGAKGYAPENTAVGFHTAADMGVSFVEFDVKLTKDFEPVVFHDDHLARIADIDSFLKDLTWAEVQEIDAGSHFGASFSGEKIPHLDEVLEICINRNMGANIEIKPCKGREVETAEVTLDYASRIWPDEMQPPLISSFSYPCLETARDMAMGWPRGFLIDESADNLPDNWLDMVKYIDPFSIHSNGNSATEDDLQLYFDLGLPVLCYTINAPLKAQELFDMGVTSVFSDVPDIIEDIL